MTDRPTEDPQEQNPASRPPHGDHPLGDCFSYEGCPACEWCVCKSRIWDGVVRSDAKCRICGEYLLGWQPSPDAKPFPARYKAHVSKQYVKESDVHLCEGGLPGEIHPA